MFFENVNFVNDCIRNEEEKFVVFIFNNNF